MHTTHTQTIARPLCLVWLDFHALKIFIVRWNYCFLQQHARPYDIEHHAEALGMGYFITTDLQILLLFDVTHQTHPAILHF